MMSSLHLPTLTELLDDPLIQAMMKADRVDRERLEHLLRRVGDGLRNASPGARRVSAAEPKQGSVPTSRRIGAAATCGRALAGHARRLGSCGAL